MIPWEHLDSAPVPGHGTLTLLRRESTYVLRVNNVDLMSSRAHGSEDALASLGCASLRTHSSARVLVGGLGFGFTLRAALDALMPGAQVHVVELLPQVVRWNRERVGHLANHPLNDPRVHVIEDDVMNVILRSRDAYDALLLDVDNGPTALTAENNQRIYSRAGIASLRAALRPRGTLAVWSAQDDAQFTSKLESAGLLVRVEHVRGHAKRRGAHHVVWLAQRTQ